MEGTNAVAVSMNKQLAPTLPDITPAKEWSQNTQDELFKQARAHGGPQAERPATPPSHPGGNPPESVIGPEATQHQPISPVTIGTDQPGYGTVPMYSGTGGTPSVHKPVVAPHIDEALAATPSAGLTEAREAIAAPNSGLFQPSPSAVPLPSSSSDLMAPSHQAPPPMNRGESTASTIMDIPGSWGKDQPCECHGLS